MAVVPDGRAATTGYRVRERFARLDAPRARPRHGPHPPDPRPPGGPGPPGGWRSGLRDGDLAQGPRRTGAPVPPCLAAGARVAVVVEAGPGGGAAPGCPRIGAGGPSGGRDLGRAAADGRQRMTGPEALLGAPGALLVIISGPSGVGKDTIIDALRDRPREPDYHYVVTCTTRGPRPGEVPGVSYQFLTRAQFHDLREAGELLEANEVHGNWYGTPRREVAAALAQGHDVILKIDVQGAMVVKQRVPEALLVFLVPPVAGGAVPAPPLARDRDRRRAGDPAAQRRHRAGAPGRLRPRRGQRDRRGRAHRRRDRGDHRAGEAPQRGPADPRRLRGARCRPRSAWISADASPAPVDGRLVEVAVDAPAGPGPRTYTYLAPPGLGDLEPGEAVLVPFGRGRPPGDRDRGRARARRPRAVACGPIAARVRSDGPLLPALSLAFAAELSDAVPGAARGRDPRDAAARDARAAGADGGGDAGRRGTDGSREPRAVAARARPARRAGREGTRRARSLEPRGPGGPAAAPAGARRRGPGGADLDAAGGGRRPPLRAAPVGHGRGPGGGRRTGGGRARRRDGRWGPARGRRSWSWPATRAVPRRGRAGGAASPSGTARRPSPASSAAASCAPRSASVRAGPSRAAPPRPVARARRAPR